MGLLLLFLLLTACQPEKHTPSSIFGQAEETAAPQAYDLEEMQATGELIAIALSGPDTYYEYRGQGFGLQYEMAKAFARSAGMRLRMEMASDTAALLAHLLDGEADIIAMEIDAAACPDGVQRLRSGWVVRAQSPRLAEAVDTWWRDDTKERFLVAAKARLAPSRRVRRQARPPMLSRQRGIISAYDDLFIRHAGSIGWDWRLLAAQCYQESAFDPKAVSWAGAQGLMQIMPATAAHLGLPRANVHDPEASISAAVRYLSELTAAFSDIHDRAERINFVLAAYNAGSGHVRDAMTLAANSGRNPHRWADVDAFILALEQPRYYRSPLVKCGYLRGSETSDYVRQIQNRWAAYRGAARAVPSTRMPQDAMGASSSSHVRPRSEVVLPPDTL